jgi:hypothetical protein
MRDILGQILFLIQLFAQATIECSARQRIAQWPFPFLLSLDPQSDAAT